MRVGKEKIRFKKEGGNFQEEDIKEIEEIKEIEKEKALEEKMLEIIKRIEESPERYKDIKYNYLTLLSNSGFDAAIQEAMNIEDDETKREIISWLDNELGKLESIY